MWKYDELYIGECSKCEELSHRLHKYGDQFLCEDCIVNKQIEQAIEEDKQAKAIAQS